MADAQEQMMSGLTDQITNMAMGKKTDFKKMFEDIEQQQMHDSVARGLKGILGAFGLGGVEIGKPDGSQTKPYAMYQVDQNGNLLSGVPGMSGLDTSFGNIGGLMDSLFGTTGGLGGAISSITGSNSSSTTSSLAGIIPGVGKPDGTMTNPYYVTTSPLSASSLLGGGNTGQPGGGLLSSLGSSLGIGGGTDSFMNNLLGGNLGGSNGGILGSLFGYNGGAGLSDLFGGSSSLATSSMDDIAELTGDTGGISSSGLLGSLGDGISSAFSWLTSLFDEGGFTGPGGKMQPAGVVHAGEYVIPANVVTKLGVPFFDQIKDGYWKGGYVGGYSNGGYVGYANGGAVSGDSSGGDGGTQVNIIDQRGQGAPAQTSQKTGPNGQKQIEVLIKDAVNQGLTDGSFDKTMNVNYGMSRAGTPR
jgi:hypothetical protein